MTLRSALALLALLAPLALALACAPDPERSRSDLHRPPAGAEPAPAPRDTRDVDRPPHDVTLPDAGVRPYDAGTPPPDAGVPPYDVALPDAGAAVYDAGAAVPDAGAALPDAGATVPDAGAPTVDAGALPPAPPPPADDDDDDDDEPEDPIEPAPQYPYEARATFYSDGPNGSCGFGADPWPYVIAPAEWMNGDGSLCGAFLEITSRHAAHPGDAEGCAKGTTIVAMVTDRCPAEGNEEWCADMSVMHLDLGTDAFAALADPRCGVVDGLEWRFVERPGDDAIRVVNKDGVNPWWYAFFVHRHRYALARAEVRDAVSSSWSEALRQPWGAFVVTSASGLVPPLDLRLTDVHGQVLVLDDVVTSLQPGAAFDSAAQFPGGLGGGDPLNLGP